MSDETNATLPAKLPALPEPWVAKIFTGMEAAYGSLFLDRWRDCNLAAVKATWAESLASFSDDPQCFGKALKSMIEECRLPPTLPEFIALCRRHYQRPMPIALPATVASSFPSRDRARELINDLARRFTTRRETTGEATE